MTSHLSSDIWKKINWLDREDIVKLLEGIGVACYDDEPTQLLRECLYDDLEAGNIEEWQLEERN